MANVHVKPEPGSGEDPAARANPLDAADGADKADDKQLAPTTDYIDQLVARTSVEELEAGVQLGVQLLESLKPPLQRILDLSSTSAAKSWLEGVRRLQESAKPSRTVVGVVGNTGAGKSSIINALLDEEKLVPTNGMRACTASATEISFNYSDNPSELYRAEVEFITAKDWADELETLLNDLLDGNGNVSRECGHPDTEAGLAYSKIKAVYPTKTKEMIADSTPESLIREAAVRSVLGSVKKLKETSCQALFRGLQTYVDSKEKQGSGTKLEYWPLIKVVRIYCKSPVLSTGVVIVDLPGVQDSNAARSAVSAAYLKNCTGLWITAAIQRAVDEKTAKNLLGDSFKRQLKYDGQYNCVTFICTKTDDILETEISGSLDLDEENGESWKQKDEIQRQLVQLRSQIRELKKEKSDIDDIMDDFDTRTEEWEDLMKKLTDGETVYRPSAPEEKKETRKRKRRSSLDSTDVRSDHGSGDDASNHEASDDAEDNHEDPPPLTEKEIEEELAACKAQKKELRKSKKEFDLKIAPLKAQETALIAEEKALTCKIKSICIKGRNEYSRTAIRNDFAMGIKELDQEAAIDRDEATFDPDQDLRNYDEVARSLSVFCVSSRAYQKLSGRLKKDTVHVEGFTELEDTEIPQLQEHGKRLTEGGRANKSRRFLNELIQLLNSMKLWVTNDGRVLNKNQQRIDEMFLRKRLTKLRQDLHTAVQDCVAAVQDTLSLQLTENLDRLAPIASANALTTAVGWGTHKDMGGIVWATYKATCRRAGVFRRDFNAELLEPITKQLAGPWEKVFQRVLPAALDSLARQSRGIINEFHNDVLLGVQDARQNPAGVNMLTQQLRTHAAALLDMPTPIKTTVTDAQREANRAFTPAITEAMRPAYVGCVEERGPGSFARMKAIMQSHVENGRDRMFGDAIEAVVNQLDSICECIEDDTIVFMQDLVGKMEADYLAVFVGEDAQAQAVIPWAERILRDEFGKHLDRADSWFAALLPVEETGPINEAAIGEPEPEPAMLNEPRSDACESDATLEEDIAQQLAGSQQPFFVPTNGVKEEPL